MVQVDSYTNIKKIIQNVSKHKQHICIIKCISNKTHLTKHSKLLQVHSYQYQNQSKKEKTRCWDGEIKKDKIEEKNYNFYQNNGNLMILN